MRNLVLLLGLLAGLAFLPANAQEARSESIESTTDDVVTNTWKVLHSTTANEDDGVLLEVVAFTTDVGDDFKAIGQADLGNFTESRVRLLRRAGHHLKADTTTLWAICHRR